MIIELRPIGFVKGGRTEPTNDDWDSVTAAIELDAGWLTEEALIGLDTFSHAEVIYYFHRCPPESIVTSARHPRGNKSWPLTGIFAQRGHFRPNLLGVTTCKVLRVNGLALVVQGLDAIDGTPVLDIKPYMTEFGPRGDIFQPDWSRKLMSEYWKKNN